MTDRNGMTSSRRSALSEVKKSSEFAGAPIDRRFANFEGNATHVAHEMVFLVKRNYCEDHGVEALLRRDFS
jgi:hypothetical protein